MARSKSWIWLALGAQLAVGGLVFAGCSSQAASKGEKKTVTPLAGVAPQRALVSKPVARPAPHESALSTYASLEYGVAFRYPRNYPLAEGPLDEATEDTPGLRNQEDLESEQPGAVLVATIAIPDDSFPNTTFAGGSVQLAVNRYLPEGGCQDFPVTHTGDAKSASGTITAGGVPFMWADSDQGEGSTEYFERDYAGFANDTCYEFFLRVGVGVTSDSDQVKPVNLEKILGQLEKIVASTQLHAKTASILDQTPSPQIRSHKH